MLLKFFEQGDTSLYLRKMNLITGYNIVRKVIGGNKGQTNITILLIFQTRVNKQLKNGTCSSRFGWLELVENSHWYPLTRAV